MTFVGIDDRLILTMSTAILRGSRETISPLPPRDNRPSASSRCLVTKAGDVARHRRLAASPYEPAVVPAIQ